MAAQNDSRTEGEPHPHSGCHYIEGYLAVQPFEVDVAIAALSEEGLEVEDVTGDALGEYLGDLEAKGERIPPPVGILQVTVDPHVAAEILDHRKRPVEASPVHGVGYESHGKYMAGDGPHRVEAELRPPETGETEGWIAVVDSGLVEETARPEWMRAPYVKDFSRGGPESIAADDASHGTFVTSLLRLVAPDVGVAFSAAPPDHAGKMTTRTPGVVVDPPTTELDVLGAIARLVEALSSSPNDVRALNLSLGAERCGPNDGFLLTLRSALDLWRQHFGNNAPIFAAGGNSDDPSPVYPAAFDCVRGVAAGIDGDVTQRVWDANENAVVARTRIWIDDVAPGLKLYGAGGSDESHVVEWSGSSFAGAVAAAQFVSGAPYAVDSGVVFWQDRPLDYRQIPGLQP